MKKNSKTMRLWVKKEVSISILEGQTVTSMNMYASGVQKGGKTMSKQL
jgi:hypothetical protein